MVDGLVWRPEYTLQMDEIKNPYMLPAKAPQIIDVYIDSQGGTLTVAKSIMSLLNIARAKGAIIRTTIIGHAASCASVIAVQGTQGFRIMYEQSYNLVHYGHSVYSVNKPVEIDKAAKYEKEMRANFFAPYLKYTNMTKAELLKLQRTEFSHISAKECLQKNMCDWILTSDGMFINRNSKQR